MNLSEEQLKAECNSAMSSYSIFQGEMENPTMTVIAQLHILNTIVTLNDSIVKNLSNEDLKRFFCCNQTNQHTLNVALPLLTDIKHWEMSYFVVHLKPHQPYLSMAVTFIMLEYFMMATAFIDDPYCSYETHSDCVTKIASLPAFPSLHPK